MPFMERLMGVAGEGRCCSGGAGRAAAGRRDPPPPTPGVIPDVIPDTQAAAPLSS